MKGDPLANLGTPGGYLNWNAFEPGQLGICDRPKIFIDVT